MKNPFRFAFALVCLFALCIPARAADLSIQSSTHLFSAGATSYAAESAMDGDPTTAWIEGVAGAGTGQWLLIEFSVESVVRKIGVTNGFQKNGSFNRHNKIKKATLVYSDGASQEFELKDEMGVQYVECRPVPTKSIKLVIDEIHPARELRFRGDTALSEIQVELDPNYAAPVETAAAKPAPEDVAEEFRDDSVEAVTPPPTATNLMVNVDQKPVKSVAIDENVSAAPKVAEGLDGLAESAETPKNQAPKSVEPAKTAAASGTRADVVPPFFQDASRKVESGGEPAAVDNVQPEAKPAAPESAPAPVAAPDAVSAAGENSVLKRLQEQYAKGVPAASEPTQSEPQAEAPKARKQSAAAGNPMLKRLQEQFEHDQSAMDSDPSAELIYVVKTYYQRMYTLDDKYDELFAESVREQEGLIFEVFRETQRKRGIYDLFREAVVDLEKLNIVPVDIDRDLAEVKVDGMFTLYLADDYNDYPEETKFVFKRERDHWKILDIK